MAMIIGFLSTGNCGCYTLVPSVFALAKSPTDSRQHAAKYCVERHGKKTKRALAFLGKYKRQSFAFLDNASNAQDFEFVC